MGELDVNINHAEYLAGTADPDGKRFLESALQKKRDYLARRPQPEFRPPTQTKPQREKNSFVFKSSIEIELFYMADE